MPAQMLAKTRPGIRGALLFHSAIATLRVRRLVARGRPAPDPPHGGRPVGAEEDLPAAREIAETIEGAELFLYPRAGFGGAAQAPRAQLPGARRVETRSTAA